MGFSTGAVTFGAVIIGVVSVAAGLLVLRARDAGVLRVVVVTAFAGVAATVGAGVILGQLGMGHFGLLHLWYLVVVVAIPIVGASFLAANRWHRKATLGAVGALMLVPAPVGWYATHIEPYRLHTDTVRVTLPNRTGTSRLRIAVLSDFQVTHVGRYERDAIDRLLAAHPDVILIPGDLFQGSADGFERTLPALRDLLSEFHAPAGVFAVRGDVDIEDRADQILAGSGIRILDDEVVQLRVDDRELLLGGNRLNYATASAVAVRNRLARDPDGPGEKPIRILLSHRPDPVLDLAPNSRVDLVVAGHTHGGQVVVPFFGPVMTLSGVPRNVARGGLHEVNGNKIVVSPGVGLERNQAPQVRFLRPPAIVIVDIDDSSH